MLSNFTFMMIFAVVDRLPLVLWTNCSFYCSTRIVIALTSVAFVYCGEMLYGLALSILQ